MSMFRYLIDRIYLLKEILRILPQHLDYFEYYPFLAKNAIVIAGCFAKKFL